MAADGGGMTMNNPKLFWLQKTICEVPSDNNDWLSANEQDYLHSLRVTNRSQDWRLGRWAAKSAVASYLRWDWNRINEIEILSATSGAPEAHLPCGDAPTISISHRGGIAMCSVGPKDSVLGCDLELIETRSDTFMRDYFTEGEFALVQQLSAAARSLFANLIWSAKESTLKALHEGLRIPTNQLEVYFPFFNGNCQEIEIESAARQQWQLLLIGYQSRQFVGWWFLEANVIHTVVGSCHRPMRLNSNLLRCGNDLRE
jgi:4'-phosphopantetheinyl transferase